MNRMLGMLLILLPLAAAPVVGQEQAGGIDVELWTNRGSEAVYKPGEGMELNVRSSDDGYLLVYEIDAEGAVRVLWPERGSPGFIEGGRTLTLPSDRSEVELVVEGPAGQGYVVAIVSREPFVDLPWFLRPYDLDGADAEVVEGVEEEGFTAEGRIVGDPFVAMERIRRRVLDYPDDPDAFGSAYTSYFVHQRVRYPRYICSDCHRPNQWAWWDGFDPYYTTCSVFDFRVNWGWNWGPRYWFSYVPHYYFVYRYDCPPSYRVYSSRYTYHSSWDGWRRWSSLWGGSLTRTKTSPPGDYIPPSKYKERRPKDRPPGFLADRLIPRGRNDRIKQPLPAGPGVERRPSGERRIGWRSTNQRIPERGALIPRSRGEGRGIRDRGLRDQDRGRLRGQDFEPRGSLRGTVDRGPRGVRRVERGRGTTDPGRPGGVLRGFQRERSRDEIGRSRRVRELVPRAVVGRDRTDRPQWERGRSGRVERPRWEPSQEHRRVERPRWEPNRELGQAERPRWEPRQEHPQVERPGREPSQEHRQVERPRSEPPRSEPRQEIRHREEPSNQPERAREGRSHRDDDGARGKGRRPGR